MKIFGSRKKTAVFFLTVLNAVLLAVSGVLTLSGGRLADSQGYNYGADRWDSGNCRQISCFLPEGTTFTADVAEGARANFTSLLSDISVTAEEGQKLIPVAYSAQAGTADIRSDTSGRAVADVTAVGGDFFLFRDFTLLDGSYFGEEDIMQDGAVIDRSLAWLLYGSEKIAGMNIYVNGVQFYISGVVENPQTEQEKDCAGENPKIYLSYEAVSGLTLQSTGTNSANSRQTAGAGGNLSGDTSDMTALTGVNNNFGSNFENENKFDTITCYECIVPNPVKNFAYNAVKDYFDGICKDEYIIVNNTERFEPYKRAKGFKKLREYAVCDKKIVLPYWENASRIAEFELSEIYFFRNLFLILPILTAIFLIIVLFVKLKKLCKRLVYMAIEKIKYINYNRQLRKIQQSVEDKE